MIKEADDKDRIRELEAEVERLRSKLCLGWGTEGHLPIMMICPYRFFEREGRYEEYLCENVRRHIRECMEMGDDLDYCPWCDSGEVHLVPVSQDVGIYAVLCTQCSCLGPSGFTGIAAIRLWNNVGKWRQTIREMYAEAELDDDGGES